MANLNQFRRNLAALSDEELRQQSKLFETFISQYPAIRRTANRACRIAANMRRDGLKLFDGEAINWANLQCTEVRWVNNGKLAHIEAVIEEADPSCVELSAFIRQRLAEDGYSVEVVTEW